MSKALYRSFLQSKFAFGILKQKCVLFNLGRAGITTINTTRSIIRTPGKSYFSTTMNKLAEMKPPSGVKGMKKFDSEAFKQTICFPGIVCPKDILDTVRKLIDPFVVRLRHFQHIVDLESEDEKHKTHRLIMLNPSKVTDFQSLPSEIKNKLEEVGVKDSDMKSKLVDIDHGNWSFSEVVRAILPDDIDEATSGFSEIGHIAHFNLRNDMLDYKYVIGEALLECSKRTKTVVNKTNAIDNTYRTFQLELLAGEENYITTVNENNCVLHMDFSKVYWNSRLGTEHSKVIKKTRAGDIVFDVFAGIGPFALPCAKRKCTVFGNDLNPVSYEYLVKNSKANKIPEDRFKAYCLDGRQFIQTVVKEELRKVYTGDWIYPEYKVYMVMNLPAIAVTFIDAFQGLFQGENLVIEPLHEPEVYCYCFTDIKEAEEHWDGDTDREIRERTRKYLPMLSNDDISLRFVRDVAPSKNMICISFTLKKEILLGSGDAEDELGEPPLKCQRIEER